MRQSALLISALAAIGCQETKVDTAEAEPVDLVKAIGPFVCLPPVDHGFPGFNPGAFEDLGSGLVSRFILFAGEESGTDWQVFDCASGVSASIQIRRSYVPMVDLLTGHSTRRVEIMDQASFNEFYGAMRSQTANDLASIKNRANRSGLKVTSYQVEEQPCGCYAAYPQLDGSKIPFPEGTMARYYEVIE